MNKERLEQMLVTIITMIVLNAQKKRTGRALMERICLPEVVDPAVYRRIVADAANLSAVKLGPMVYAAYEKMAEEQTEVACSMAEKELRRLVRLVPTVRTLRGNADAVGVLRLVTDLMDVAGRMVWSDMDVVEFKALAQWFKEEKVDGEAWE